MQTPALRTYIWVHFGHACLLNVFMCFSWTNYHACLFRGLRNVFIFQISKGLCICYSIVHQNKFKFKVDEFLTGLIGGFIIYYTNFKNLEIFFFKFN